MRGNGSCGHSILVADGDADCRALVSELFGRVGLFTREASSGYEALELAESSRPSLVLLDVELPGMSGYETCRELRNLYGETLPLILLSGTRVEALDRIAGLLIGADDYIVKPFDPGELLARARLLLRRNGNGQEHRNGHSPSLDSLTPREREVLDLLAEGRSQDEIAQELFITPKTVATHISSECSGSSASTAGPKQSQSHCATGSASRRKISSPTCTTSARASKPVSDRRRGFRPMCVPELATTRGREAMFAASGNNAPRRTVIW